MEGRFRYKSSKQCQHLKAKAGGQTCFLMSFYKFLSLQMTVPLQSKTPQISGKKRGLDEVTLPIIGYWIILDPAGYHSCLGWNKEQLLSTGWKMNSLLGVNSIKTCAEASNYFLTSLKSSIFTHNLCFVDIINFPELHIVSLSPYCWIIVMQQPGIKAILSVIRASIEMFDQDKHVRSCCLVMSPVQSGPNQQTCHLYRVCGLWAW